MNRPYIFNENSLYVNVATKVFLWYACATIGTN